MSYFRQQRISVQRITTDLLASLLIVDSWAAAAAAAAGGSAVNLMMLRRRCQHPGDVARRLCERHA